MLVENPLDQLRHSMNGAAASPSDADGEDPKQELLLQQLQAIDEEGAAEQPLTWPRRLLNAWKGLPFKAALGHVGLLFSLSMYCGLGGLVTCTPPAGQIHFVEVIVYTASNTHCNYVPPDNNRAVIHHAAPDTTTIPPTCMRLFARHNYA